jgi:hypothetical protein
MLGGKIFIYYISNIFIFDFKISFELDLWLLINTTSIIVNFGGAATKTPVPRNFGTSRRPMGYSRYLTFGFCWFARVRVEVPKST